MVLGCFLCLFVLGTLVVLAADQNPCPIPLKLATVFSVDEEIRLKEKEERRLELEKKLEQQEPPAPLVEEKFTSPTPVLKVTLDQKKPSACNDHQIQAWVFKYPAGFTGKEDFTAVKGRTPQQGWDVQVKIIREDKGSVETLTGRTNHNGFASFMWKKTEPGTYTLKFFGSKRNEVLELCAEKKVTIKECKVSLIINH